jgi:uncharacterized protein
MEFIVIGRDYKDALERRMKVRGDHIALGDKMKAAGNYLYGVALLDKVGKMCGSVLIYDFPSRKELDEHLKTEPYVVGNVWEKIEVSECRTGPTFIK